MIYKPYYRLITILMIAMSIGCFKGHSPVAPPVNHDSGGTPELSPDAQGQSSTGNQRVLLTYNLLYIDPSDPTNIEVEAIPMREAEIHLNILIFLEKSACQNCFAVTGAWIVSPGVIDVDIRITHPLTDDLYTIFDVRGIMMFQAGYTFQESGLSCADPSAGNCYLANPDGYTSLYNITTLGIPLILQKYQKGKYSTVTPPASTVNGYIRHWSDVAGNDRMAFLATTSDTKTYRLGIGPAPLVIGYAVDANWTLPLVQPVEDPLTDFGPEANCPEPWKINAWADPVCVGHQTEVVIDIYDWQGMSTYHAPVVECNELFNGTATATWEKDGPDFSRWRATISNTKLPAPGIYKCLVGVEANENDPIGKPWLDLTAYQIVNITNLPDPIYGWAQTFGGPALDMCRDIAIDSSGNLYVTGYFQETVDFDPGAGNVPYTSNGGKDVFVAKYTSAGNFVWAKAWGAAEDDIGRSVAVDSFGDVYITGSFRDVCDFDPDPTDTFWGNSGDMGDIFVTKLDSDGNFVWLQNWGGEKDDSGRRIIIDSANNAIVAGYDCIGTYNYRTWLASFDIDGNQNWLKMWDGSGDLLADSNGLALDDSGNIYICGAYEGMVDFDPDSGTENHTSAGTYDGFLCKYTSSGIFTWVRTWGGICHDNAESVAIDKDGNIYMTGVFENVSDFDPGPGTWILEGNNWDAFLCKYDPDGEFLWATSWGGDDFSDFITTYYDVGYDLDTDSFGDIYVTGTYMDNSIMDPIFTNLTNANGKADIFLSKFGSNGVLKWSRTWGGVDGKVGSTYYIDRGYGICIDDSDSLYVCGQFIDDVTPVDFNPGAGNDPHMSNGGLDAYVERVLLNGYWE
ncbi:MAG: SBBP repeat-containing protein [bacterium]|nr:SBBP repeat-containing protein [bacterium]